jgi:Zn-dependent protease with chaperone function
MPAAQVEPTASDQSAASRRRLLGLAALALAVNASFYLLLLAITLGFFAALVAIAVVFGRLGLYLVVVPAGVLFYALRRSIRAALPTRRSHAQNGVPVNKRREESLWTVADDVCRALVQRSFDELRITFRQEASAREVRDGFGRPARRVLTLPLCYLQALGEPELRAVIAHEVSHFASGDVALGRRLLGVEQALGRTLWRLDRLGSVLRHPFRLYARILHRRLASISRSREFAADSYAARLSGAPTMARALRITEWVENAFSLYWRNDVAPALDQGLRPPITSGFGEVLSSPAIIAGIDYLRGDQLETEFASHPTIVDRLLALRADAPATPSLAQAAVGLVTDLEVLEIELLGERAAKLRGATWGEARQATTRAAWQKTLLSSAPLPEMAVGDIAGFLDDEELRDEDSEPAEQAYLAFRLGCAVALTLADAGWQLDAPLAGAVAFHRGERVVYPVEEVVAISQSALLRTQWKARCEETGMDAMMLSPHLREVDSTTKASPAVTAASLPLESREVRGPMSRGLMWTSWIVGGACVPGLIVAAVKAPTPSATVVIAISDALIVGGLAWLAHITSIGRQTPARVEFDGAGLRLIHPYLLKEDLRIALDGVRVISVDPSAGGDRRFPIYADSDWSDPNAMGGDPRGWFWADGRPARPSPLYGLHRQTPNMLVVLEAPVSVPRVRRERLHGPLNGETMTAFTLRLADPKAAAVDLTALGFNRRLVISDLRPASGGAASPPERSSAASSS